jgi:hypothetical protein
MEGDGNDDFCPIQAVFPVGTGSFVVTFSPVMLLIRV